MTDPLTRLAILNGTDKFGYHDYTPHYFGLLNHLRDEPLKLLEIGVGGYGSPVRGGESLAVWRDFFPEGQITGLDIQRKTIDLGSRVRIVQGSQVDADCLSQIEAERGPFDVILDDGSHRNEHVVESFALLFPGLKPGGLYLVEDVQTSFFPRFGGSLTLDAPNSVGMAAEIMAQLQRGEGGEIVAVERFHNIFAFWKRDPGQPAPGIENDRRVRAADGVTRIAADSVTDAAALMQAVDRVGEAGLLLIEGRPDPALLLQLFVEVDHTEIRVHFPDAPLLPTAPRILGMAIYGDGVVLQVGDNTYPSNFDYSPENPLAAAAMATISEVITDPAATENGLQQAAVMTERFHGADAAAPLLQRLSQMGCTDQRFYLLYAKLLRQSEDWPAMERLCREALTHLPDDPQVLPTLALALRRQGRLDEALELLRTAHEANPRVRSIVTTLANLEVSVGNRPRAIELLEKAMVLFPPADRAGRQRKLIELCLASGDQEAAQRVARRLREAVPDDPLATEVLGPVADSDAKS
ncbi:class I SAM-dependent methyltransferase [uncultured Paracoccus sp.]|uniref:class I SAM-dependent methyltransferase n=1 Tax=uncultured Paracoccus sp. TaxID=189685 RepID=UPI0026226851|nr:class I SAM-dependent methyltransferase [uncultured Paracoccus sp.]